MTNILIIEDDEKIQQLLESALLELNANLKIAVTASAADALVMSQKKQFDVFIVDIQLVDYKGTDLVEQLRSTQTYKYTPIIFETAVVTEELRAYRELKSYHYLIKPYTKDEIKKVMAEVLGYLQQTITDDRTLRIEQRGFIFEYRLQDILYIESFGKKMIIHLLTDQVVRQERITGYSLKGLLDLLKDGPFLQCHKSYILNTTYIEAIDKVESLVKLRHCSTTLPIGLKYRKQILES